ncbi:MAG: DUF2163 domain-containing protein [Proteobacteria bacterium]|nr:DUF2163 domain-containing protein [Pseudomonadota bacterium]
MTNAAQLLKTIDPDLTDLCMCWELQLTNNKTLHFTNHHTDVHIENKIYNAATSQASGIIASYVESDANIAAGVVEVTLSFANPNISEKEVCSGLYENAKVQILLAKITKSDVMPITLYQGFIGNIKIGNGYFTAELLDNRALFAKGFVSHYSTQCRAIFCDAKCGLKASDHTISGTIVQHLDSVTLIGNNLAVVDNRYNGGILSMISGQASGVKLSICSVQADRILLALPCEYNIAIGDKYELTAGCDKSFSTCANLYNNAINFRGEPHLPGDTAKIPGI